MPVAVWLCIRVIKQSAFVKHVLDREEGFRQTAIQNCCTAGCFAWEYPSTDPGHVQIGVDQALHISTGHEQQLWQHGDGSSTELFHLGQQESVNSVNNQRAKELNKLPCCISNCCRNGTEGNSYFNTDQNKYLCSYFRSNCEDSLKRLLEDFFFY